MQPRMKRQKKMKKDMVEVSLHGQGVTPCVFSLLVGSKVTHIKRKYEEESGYPSHLFHVVVEGGGGEVLEDGVLLYDEMSLLVRMCEDGSQEDLFKHYGGYCEGEGDGARARIKFNGGRVTSASKEVVVRRRGCDEDEGEGEGGEGKGGVDPLDLMPTRMTLKCALNTMFSNDLSHFCRSSIAMATGTVSYSAESTSDTVCRKFTISFPSEEGGAIGQPAFVVLGVGFSQGEDNNNPQLAKKWLFPAVLKSATECDETFELFIEMTPMRVTMGLGQHDELVDALRGMWEVRCKCVRLGQQRRRLDDDDRWHLKRARIPNMSFMMGVAGHAVVTTEPYPESYAY
jgi:hypothetical protein